MQWDAATSLGESICRGFRLAYLLEKSKKGTMQLQTKISIMCNNHHFLKAYILHFSFPISCISLEGLDFISNSTMYINKLLYLDHF